MTDKTDVMRGEFEASVVRRNGTASEWLFEQDSEGRYTSDPMQVAWEGYQAALQSPAVRELVEASNILIETVSFENYWPAKKRLRKALANFASIKGDKA